jgi:hypothetical protein
MTTQNLDPDRIIADAEQEAIEAEQLVGTLEEKVRSGDDSVTFEEVEKARGLLSFVRLRKEAAKRKADEARESARLAACTALREEVEAHAKGDGEKLRTQLQAAVDALRALYSLAEDRNASVREYRRRAAVLGIPEQLHRGPAAATHGGVRLTPGGGVGVSAGLIVGCHRVEGVEINNFVNRALHLLKREGKFTYLDYVDSGDDLFGDLAAIDAEAPESSAKYFYRGPQGTVFGKDEPFSAEEIKRSGLTVITEAEARAE